MVNLPVAIRPGRLALTLLGSDYVVDLEITAAQARAAARSSRRRA
jgi:hypothetical protein